MQRRRSGGFTLIELLVVLGIMGVLAWMILPLGETLVRARHERELKAALWEIREAIDQYKKAADLGRIDAGPSGFGYPPNLDVLVSGVAAKEAADSKSASEQGGAGERRVTVDAQKTESELRPIFFLRRLPRDPFAPQELPAAATWRLRSYASPPSQPEPGEDVYDVRSSSDGVALDGSRYASW